VQVRGRGAGAGGADGAAVEKDVGRTPDNGQQEAVARIPGIDRRQDMGQETAQKSDAEESEVVQKITEGEGGFERA
jgi:hypothetical protein